MGAPEGALGVEWGDTLEAAATRLGVVCEGTEAWEGGQGFESCQDFDHPVNAFGSQASVRLIGKDGRLEGVELSFRDCSEWERLRDAVRAEFRLSTESETDAYQTWHGGEAVRLTHDARDHSCVLTVAGARFGPAFVNYILAGGFGQLGAGLRP